MKSRYIGRATGTRRKGKHFPLIWILATGVAACGVALIAVLIMNYGADRPGEQGGSQSSTGVTPTTTTPTPTATKHRGTAQ